MGVGGLTSSPSAFCITPITIITAAVHHQIDQSTPTAFHDHEVVFTALPGAVLDYRFTAPDRRRIARYHMAPRPPTLPRSMIVVQ
jgi:hypothetical protein